jgi:hypothetical protein
MTDLTTTSRPASDATTLAPTRKPAQRRFPKRYSYLENSLMAREMNRL